MEIIKETVQKKAPGLLDLDFRQALSQFPTGVIVVTAFNKDGKWIGKTISSFNSVSVDPPLVLWSLSVKTKALNIFLETSKYVINVLASDQIQIAKLFSSKNENLFDGIKTVLSEDGIPIIDGGVASFECHNKTQYLEGDHLIFIGAVKKCSMNPKPALLFHQSEFSSTEYARTEL